MKLYAVDIISGFHFPDKEKQVAQMATIAHLVASIMSGDTIFYKAQRPVSLNLKQPSGLNSNYYASSAYLQVLKRSELKWLKKPSRAANSIVSDGT